MRTIGPADWTVILWSLVGRDLLAGVVGPKPMVLTPVKTKVIINGWEIGRDPHHWTEAERFIPERFVDSPIDYKGNNFEHIPFGSGRRICPGILFAIPNIELPLADMLYHFDWELPYGMKQEDLDMTEVARRKQDLYLIPIPYNPFHVE